MSDLYQQLILPSSEKLVLLVLDGLGDIATEETGRTTPLEKAHTPNLDRLAAASALGRMIPVRPGITPGSGPGHLGLFGYDPVEVQVGRGVIEALGLDIDLRPGDLAARANFCTLDAGGQIADRRAGRIATDINQRLTARLRERIQRIEDVEILIQSGKAHRFVVIFRGPGLDGPILDTDPHHEGAPILPPRPARETPGALKAVRIIKAFYDQALPLLRDAAPANAFLMRGIDMKPAIATLTERFGLKAAAIATYPMYRGLAQLCGMTKVATGDAPADEFQTYLDRYDEFQYFFIHIKPTDAAGEDGNFDQKRAVIEQVDAALPVLLSRKPRVLAITGDHSTPCPMRGHSWHPIPVLLHSPVCGIDGAARFTERTCNTGSLGFFESKYLLPLMLANAGMLDKYGA